jgi:predicted enzyme related to lactoylglutathione lyase
MTDHRKAYSIEWLVIPAPNLELAKSFYANVFRFEVSDYSDTFAVFKAGNITAAAWIVNSSLPPSVLAAP